MTDAQITIRQLDHLVLTVADLDRTIQFYQQVLGMQVIVFGEGRFALQFGDQKINLHHVERTFEPKAGKPTPGSADLCFWVETPLAVAALHLQQHGITPEAGPVPRTGARGPIQSLYLRDPDGNLIELANYADSAPTAH
ncbi:MAG: VOC family protein [Roseiflexaceae bacterium]